MNIANAEILLTADMILGMLFKEHPALSVLPDVSSLMFIFSNFSPPEPE